MLATWGASSVWQSSRSHASVFLHDATSRDAARLSSKGGYAKGRDAFVLLAQADPAALRSRLPHFRRFVAALEERLTPDA